MAESGQKHGHFGTRRNTTRSRGHGRRSRPVTRAVRTVRVDPRQGTRPLRRPGRPGRLSRRLRQVRQRDRRLRRNLCRPERTRLRRAPSRRERRQSRGGHRYLRPQSLSELSFSLSRCSSAGTGGVPVPTVRCPASSGRRVAPRPVHGRISQPDPRSSHAGPAAVHTLSRIRRLERLASGLPQLPRIISEAIIVISLFRGPEAGTTGRQGGSR